MAPRSHLPREERELVSQLHRLLSQPGLMRATLVATQRRCGKPTCRCAEGAYRHHSVYVSQSRRGRPYMRCVPKECKEWEARVRAWIERYQQVRVLLDCLSQLYWERLEHREE